MTEGQLIWIAKRFRELEGAIEDPRLKRPDRWMAYTKAWATRDFCLESCRDDMTAMQVEIRWLQGEKLRHGDRSWLTARGRI